MTTPKQSAVSDLLTDVATRIKGSAAAVSERFRDLLVEREVSDRVALLDKAVTKRRTLVSEQRKIDRPDNVAYNRDGSEAGGTFSKERLKSLEAGTKALDKLEKAIEAALVGGEWGKLKDAVK